MKNTLLKSWPTGRSWGQKKEPKLIRRTQAGEEFEADYWEGPVEPGEQGQYWRGRWLGRMR